MAPLPAHLEGKTTRISLFFALGVLAIVAISCSPISPKRGVQPSPSKIPISQAVTESNLPCWIENENCGAQPGMLYFVGKISTRKPGGGSLSRGILTKGATLVAQSKFAYALRTNVSVFQSVKTKCRNRVGAEEKCSEQIYEKLEFETEAMVRATQLRLNDEFQSRDNFLYVRLAVPRQVFDESLKRVISRLKSY